MEDSCVSPLHASQVHGVAVSDLLDRLSELPNSLILVILSLLPMMEVVRTTVLSKRWKDLWTFVPCLHFQNHHTLIDFDKFRNFLLGALVNWKGPKILKFRIDFMFHTHLAGFIDSLLLFAILKQVEELHIELTECERVWHYVERESNYCPPQILYSCSFITNLTLVSVELNIGGSVNWSKLKNLTIEGADSVTEEAMNQILSGAPLLEVLNLGIKESSEDLNIRSTSLKVLKIDVYGVGSVYIIEDETFLRIWAPNLESMEISGVSYSRCLINVPSLISASLCFDEKDYIFMDTSRYLMLWEMSRNLYQSISHVEKLTLTDWCIKDLSNTKKDTFVLFSNVKVLRLYLGDSEGMLDVLEMFPELMILIVEHNEYNSLFQDEEPFTLEVDACKSMASKTVSPRFSTLQLKTVKLTWHVREKSDSLILEAIETLLGNCPVLKKMMIRVRTHREMYVLIEEKVLSMPRSSPTAELIIIKY